MSSNIFKRYICDFCGKIEYKEYLGTKEFDGGYTAVNEFEPTSYNTLRIGDKGYKLCPECMNKIENFIEAYKQKVFEKEDKNEST